MTEFRAAAVDAGDGGTLVRAMAVEMGELYPGLVLDDPSMPKAGPAELGPPGGGFWVGYDEAGAPACCGGFKRLEDRACEIKRMYVVPAARGRGLARQLLGYLEERATEHGYAVVRLDTGPLQLGAQHLYDSTGYRRIGNFNANPVATYFGEKAL